jgi:hypothetical protein
MQPITVEELLEKIKVLKIALLQKSSVTQKIREEVNPQDNPRYWAFCNGEINAYQDTLMVLQNIGL